MLHLVAVGSWVGLLPLTASGQLQLWRSAGAIRSKFLSFHSAKTTLSFPTSLLQARIGTSIRRKKTQLNSQSRALNLNTHCGISQGISWCKTNTVVMILRRQSCSLILMYWMTNWSRRYKVCVMTRYDVGHPIRRDQFRHRPQTVCREGASAIKSV